MAPSVSGIGPQLKSGGQSKVCVFGTDVAVGDEVKITRGTDVWSGDVTKVTSIGTIKYGSAKVSRSGTADTSKDVEKDFFDDDLGGVTVTVTRGPESSTVADGSVVDP